MADCVFLKKAGEALDYTQDWSAELGTDTISSSSWAYTGGIAGSGDSVGSPAQTTTVRLSGGAFGATAEAINTIVTVGGNTLVATIAVRIT